MLQKVGNLSVAVSFICPETDVKSVGMQGTLGRHGGKFCVSDIRQSQKYHMINVHIGGLFPLVTAFLGGRGGMRAEGVNAVTASQEPYPKGISPPCGQRTGCPAD